MKRKEKRALHERWRRPPETLDEIAAVWRLAVEVLARHRYNEVAKKHDWPLFGDTVADDTEGMHGEYQAMFLLDAHDDLTLAAQSLAPLTPERP